MSMCETEGMLLLLLLLVVGTTYNNFCIKTNNTQKQLPTPPAPTNLTNKHAKKQQELKVSARERASTSSIKKEPFSPKSTRQANKHKLKFSDVCKQGTMLGFVSRLWQLRKNTTTYDGYASCDWFKKLAPQTLRVSAND